MEKNQPCSSSEDEGKKKKKQRTKTTKVEKEKKKPDKKEVPASRKIFSFFSAEKGGPATVTGTPSPEKKEAAVTKKKPKTPPKKTTKKNPIVLDSDEEQEKRQEKVEKEPVAKRKKASEEEDDVVTIPLPKIDAKTTPATAAEDTKKDVEMVIPDSPPTVVAAAAAPLPDEKHEPPPPPPGFMWGTKDPSEKNRRKFAKATSSPIKPTTNPEKGLESPVLPIKKSPPKASPKEEKAPEPRRWVDELRGSPQSLRRTPAEESPSASVIEEKKKKNKESPTPKKRTRRSSEGSGTEGTAVVAAAAKAPSPKRPTKETPPKKKTKREEADEEKEKKERETPKKKWNPMFAAGPPDRSALNPHSKPMPTGSANCLAGLTFTVTGRLESLGREEVTELIERYGGVVQQGAGKRVTHVVMGIDGGESKKRAAEERGLRIVSEDELFELIRTSPAQPDSAVKKSPKKAKKATAPAPAPVPPLPLMSGRIPGAAAASASEQKDLLWVDKYAPKSMSQMVLQTRAVTEKLTRWLNGWAREGKAVPVGKFAQNAVLISGGPGIGKSTAARLACAECGFVPLELNASDTRSKKTLKESVEETLRSGSITQFCSSGGTGNRGKTALIMDEVDGMSAGDRGGVAELIALIKTTRVPVLCICNDRSSTKVKSLAKSCVDLQFAKPMPEQVATRLLDIARAEKVPITMEDARKLAGTADCDIRQSIHLLHLMTLGAARDGTSVQDAIGQAAQKDVDLSPFDVAARMLSYAGSNIEQKMRFYFSDYDMMPLLVQENYVHVNPRRAGRLIQHIDLVSSAADDISASDVLSKQIRRNGRWELLHEHAAMSCILPSYSVAGPLSLPGGRPAFPMWLGRNSTGTKNRRLLKEMQIRMRVAACGATQEELVVEYMPSLYGRLTAPLTEGEAAGVDEVSELLSSYEMSREDWETITSDLSLRREPPKVSSATKAALTRKCNARQVGHIVKLPKRQADDAVAAAATAGPAEVVGEREAEEQRKLPTSEEGGEESDEAGEEDDEEDPGKDKLIKSVTPKSGKKQSTEPRKPRSKKK